MQIAQFDTSTRREISCVLGFAGSSLGDGSENNWTLWRKHFSSFTPILDIIHALSYVFAAATAGRPFADGWCYYKRWMSWLWQGKVLEVIAELAKRQAELGVPHEGDGETHPRVLVNAALGYLQNHKDKMNYPEYRRLGLPITSSYVESEAAFDAEGQTVMIVPTELVPVIRELIAKRRGA